MAAQTESTTYHPPSPTHSPPFGISPEDLNQLTKPPPPPPPPISTTPTLRRLTSNNSSNGHSLSSLLNPHAPASTTSPGQLLELAERRDWHIRTGRADALALPLSLSTQTPPTRDGARDRWGNRWGIENHILSPVISERTEPTHTSASSPQSTSSRSISNRINSMLGQDHLLANSSDPNHPQSSPSLQHPINSINRRKIKSQITNRQRDLDVAHRQITKRIEKQKRDQMISRRDEIAAQLMKDPSDAKLVRDLGKLYLEFHHPIGLDNKSFDPSRWARSSQTPSRSEPSLKLAIHYLEQSIQIDNLDPLTWLYLAKAWSLLIAYPTEHAHEREQRLSNSSLAFRKAIVISSNLSDSSHQAIQQANQFRLAYAEHLEGLEKYNESASILQDALENEENNPDCWWALGRMMELWAQDTRSGSTRERAERMKHSCEAYQKATELKPDHLTIRQSRSKAQQVLEKLESDLIEEEARALKAEQDVKLAVEQIRALNLSPVAKASSIKSNQKKSTLALKKLVSDLREIPEFGRKPDFSSSSTDPNPLFPPAEQTKETAGRSIVESVASSSSPPLVVPPIQAPASEIDSDHFSPSSQTIPESSFPDPKIPPSSSINAIPAKNPARYSSHISPISISPSTENSSPASTQSRDDVKMTVMSVGTGSTESKNYGDRPTLSAFHPHSSSSYGPPSPSTLPTSMMHSLSGRSAASKSSAATSSAHCPPNMDPATPKCSPKITASSQSRSASRISSALQSPISSHRPENSPSSAPARKLEHAILSPNQSSELPAHHHHHHTWIDPTAHVPGSSRAEFSSPLSRELRIGADYADRPSPPPPLIPPRPQSMSIHRVPHISFNHPARTFSPSPSQKQSVLPALPPSPAPSFAPRSSLSSAKNRSSVCVEQRAPSIHQPDEHPVYDYTLIDSHLQSILAIDLKRKAELKEIKKQIRITDEWAESQRRKLVDELRRICTPVGGISGNVPVAPDPGRRCASRASSRSKTGDEHLQPADHSKLHQRWAHLAPTGPAPNTRRCMSTPPEMPNPIGVKHPHPSAHLPQPDLFENLGPAGFAINGITSIIQLLHQNQPR